MKRIEFKECSSCEFNGCNATVCLCSKLGLAWHHLLKELHLKKSNEKRCNWYLRIFTKEE